MNSPRYWYWWAAVAALLATERTATAAEQTTLTKSHFARYGTNRVHYLTAGKGKETVVLIHGWGGNTEFWKDQVPVLADKARVIVIDLPGHGKSDKPKVDYTMEFFAGGVLAVLQDARADKATLAGHSMGVPVICSVYAKAPEKVAGLVPVDGLLRKPDASAEDLEKFIAPFRAPDYQEHIKKFIAAMFPDPATEQLRDWTLAQVLATPQYVLSSAMDGMFKPGQASWKVEKIKVPLLVINAKNPRWTPEYETYVRSLSPTVEYVTMEGVGHFIMGEKPAEFNKLLISLLEKHQLIK